MSELKKQVQAAVRAIRKHNKSKPKIGIVLGTGLGALANKIKVTTRIYYEDIPHFPTSTVETHAGELIFGTLQGKPILALSGRFHYYEGYSMQDVTFPIRVAKALGIKSLIVSNACGGLNPAYKAGDLMVISDHINFMGDNPLIGPNDDSMGPRFPDMCDPYTPALIELAETQALKLGIKLQHGVYLACAGPNLETRAEYRMMRFMGADVVGMSTVPEVIVAVHAGLKVLGFSAITDECMPDALEPVDIDKIIAIANKAEPTLAKLVSACVAKM
ncbi:MAG: purine-nucleoside phosphorylase [Candidatus Hydrogenedentota bacterium]|nr:MAG: purine-nucleoside phosphorylase [Candidatus Hydrogenedentota bacterium]